jgi:hypothetical protein
MTDAIYTALTGPADPTGDQAAIVYLAAGVVDYTPEPFTGTLDDALTIMTAYAALVEGMNGDQAQTHLTRNLRASDPDKVAEICAAALLRLAKEIR